MADVALLPCPFCGETKFFYGPHGPNCSNCLAIFPGVGGNLNVDSTESAYVLIRSDNIASIEPYDETKHGVIK
jgi:hypothetical protein